MCLLAVCETRHLTWEEFDAAWFNNQDGVGFAWHEKAHNHYEKGFDKELDAWDSYKQMNQFPHMVHFRLASYGGVRRSLTHPFIVGDPHKNLTYMGNEPLLAHNGVISGWINMLHLLTMNGIKTEPPYSDTSVLSKMLGFYNKLGMDLVNVLKETDGKYALMATDGQITMVGNFINKDGVYFSNEYSLTKYKTTTTHDDTYINAPYGKRVKRYTYNRDTASYDYTDCDEEEQAYLDELYDTIKKEEKASAFPELNLEDEADLVDEEKVLYLDDLEDYDEEIYNRKGM